MSCPNFAQCKMVQVQELKEFCYFIDIQYKQILRSVKTRWLSLQPAITRLISMFLTLNSYFLSQEKCLMIQYPLYGCISRTVR
jgi:hypothetical protein